MFKWLLQVGLLQLQLPAFGVGEDSESEAAFLGLLIHGYSPQAAWSIGGAWSQEQYR